MKPPAVERAVQTTPPIISAAVMPAVPFEPMLTSTSEARISVMRVIPETGLLADDGDGVGCDRREKGTR